MSAKTLQAESALSQRQFIKYFGLGVVELQNIGDGGKLLDKRQRPVAGAQVHVVEALRIGEILHQAKKCCLHMRVCLREGSKVKPIGRKSNHARKERSVNLQAIESRRPVNGEGR